MAHTNGFTENPDLYRESKAHAEVPDLESVHSLLPPLAGLAGLDIATGTGHTAFYFAEKHVDMFAVDIDQSMLAVAQEESDRKTLGIRFLKCPAEDLMFDDDTFDLVTCRLAAHHFQALPPWLSECRRVLKPGGHLLVVDNVVHENKGAGDWMNQYETKRDSSHVSCLTAKGWSELLEKEQFQLVDSSPFPKTLDFQAWMERMSKSEEERDNLWAELLAAPQDVLELWQPRTEDKKRVLTLQRQVMLAKLK